MKLPCWLFSHDYKYDGQVVPGKMIMEPVGNVSFEVVQIKKITFYRCSKCGKTKEITER